MYTTLTALALGVTSVMAADVQVELWYESFCPGCQQLITTVLGPSVSGLTGAVDFSLVPSGNAEKFGNKLNCQHGPDECTGNAYENCVKDATNDQFEKYFPFILCMEKNGDDMLEASSIKKCAKKAKVDYDSIEACATGKEGKALNLKAYNATGQHTYVPWLRINGKHVPAAENSQEAFLKAVCKEIKGEKPAACKNEVSVVPRCYKN